MENKLTTHNDSIMKRILIIRSNPVNPDSRVEKIALSLIKTGYFVEILAWNRESEHDFVRTKLILESTEIPIIRIGVYATIGGGFRKNIRPLLIFQKKIKLWIKKNHKNYDIIHACDFDTAYTTRKMIRKYNLRFVYDIFDYYIHSFNVPKIIKPLIEWLDNKVISSADVTIICNEKRREQIKKSKPKNLVVIHNSPQDYTNKINANVTCLLSKTKLIKIVYIGILGDGRMLVELVDRISNVKNIELHIGGFGPLEEYIKKIASKSNNVFFYGRTDYSQTLSIESQCDIITAIYDPTVENHKYAAPNKFYEALMLGKPLIVCEDTGIDEIVEEHNLGTVCSFDIDSIMIGINYLISKKQEWAQIQKRGRNLYVNEYSWAIMEKRLLTLYRNLSTK